mmetsp:Transcript_22110/g.40558  ORF Transcript_22110/g.40558 Transcript_22110/m.40558 type:complete len:216 (+) Transcript_22110:756-1403(+)
MMEFIEEEQKNNNNTVVIASKQGSSNRHREAAATTRKIDGFPADILTGKTNGTSDGGLKQQSDNNNESSSKLSTIKKSSSRNSRKRSRSEQQDKADDSTMDFVVEEEPKKNSTVNSSMVADGGDSTTARKEKGLPADLLGKKNASDDGPSEKGIFDNEKTDGAGGTSEPSNSVVSRADGGAILRTSTGSQRMPPVCQTPAKKEGTLPAGEKLCSM